MKMIKTAFRRCVIVLFVLCMTAVMAISVSAKISGAQLTIDGYKSREIISYTYSFTSATDNEGQVTGIPRGGMLTVEVKALNDGNCDLLSWMLQRNLPKNGQIDINDPATAKAIKTIKFENAYCVNFKEGMTEDGIHTEIITISCGILTNGNEKYESSWIHATGSVLSNGNPWIILAIVVIAAGGITALVIVNKKKKPALADGADRDET